MNNEVAYNILLLICIIVLANLPYKGKFFDKFNFRLSMLCAGSFILGSVLLLFLVKDNLKLNLELFYFSVFIIISFLWFLSPYLVRRYGKYPLYYIGDKANKGRFLAKFELHSMTVKYFEILFQQSIFLYLLFVILSFNILSTNLVVFILIVAIIHLGNLPFLGVKWTLIYTALSVPMALVFGILILNGYILITTSIHLLFYLIFNGQLWFVKNQFSSRKS